MDELFSGSELIELETSKGKKFVWIAVPVCLAIVAILVLWAPASRSLSSQTMSVTTLEAGPEEPESPAASSTEVDQLSSMQFDSTGSAITVEQVEEKRSFIPEVTTSSTVAKKKEDEVEKRETTTSQKVVVTTKPSTTKKSVTTTEKTTTTERLPTPSAHQLNALRHCQTGGDYKKVNASGVNFGAYDFMQSSWNAMAESSGRPDLVDVRPDKATPQDQDFLALELYYGGYTLQSWPECGSQLLS